MIPKTVVEVRVGDAVELLVGDRIGNSKVSFGRGSRVAVWVGVGELVGVTVGLGDAV